MTKRDELALAIRRSLKIDLNTLQVVTGEDEAVDAVLAVLREASPEMIEAALLSTTTWRAIAGSKLTVNREKMRRRWAAMIDSILEEPKS